MKNKRMYIGICFVALLLCMVTVVGSVLPVAAAESEAPFPSMDYGIPDRADNLTWSAEQLYEKVFGKTPTAAVKTYLSERGFSFTYHSEFPNGLVNTHYESEIGRLSVTINSYSYLASNGEQVLWYPTALTVDGKKEEMTKQADGTYICILDELFYTDDFNMTVDYAWDVTIPKALLEEVCTKPYAIGLSALERQQAYTDACRMYAEQMEAYEAWQAYLAWKEIDNAYQAELIAHYAAVDAYNTYLTARKAYNDQQTLIEQWNRYYDARGFYDTQVIAYQNYLDYTAKLKLIEGRLGLLESVYLCDSHGWMLYSSIIGNIVTDVLADKDLLVKQLLVPQEVVDKADRSTKVLRELLPQYAKLRSTIYDTKHERTAALYAFYCEHYEELGASFKDLYEALSRLYKESTVRIAIDSKNQREHYEQFVSQLYVMSTCLDESVTRPADGEADPYFADWLDKQLKDVVEDAQRIPDGVWTPVGLSMPDEVPVTTKPIEPVAPTVPYPDSVLSEPTAVANPGNAPVQPQNPYENGAIPSETEHPGTAPAAPVLTDLERALAAEVVSGTLTPYTGTVEDFDLHFENRIQHSVSIRNLKTVSFHDYQGNLITTKTVDFGGSADCALPSRDANAQFTYEALGWVLHDGTDATALLQAVTTDLSLYPSYQATLRSYDITWEFDGEQIVTTHPYGTTPEVPKQWLLESYEKNHYVYSFSGWFDEDGAPVAIEAVTGPATYRGNMIKTLKNYTVTWILYDGMELTETLPAFTTPAFSGSTDRPADAYRYIFEGWDRAMAPLTRDVTYRAVYGSVKLVSGGFGGGTLLTPEYAEDRVTVQAGSEVLVDIEGLLDYAAEEGKEIAIHWENGVSLTVAQDSISAFQEASVHRVILRRSGDSSGGITYSLILQDASGSSTSRLSKSVKLVLPLTDAPAGNAFFLKTEEGLVPLQGNEVEVSASATILQYNVYTISVIPNEHCDTRPIPTSSIAGEVISLRLDCFYGYEIAGVTVTDADGNSVPVTEDMTFVMPNSAVKITFDIQQIVYTVIFRVDGNIISQKEYAPGEAIELPADPIKELDDGYIYIFSTWGDVLSTAGGDTRELIYDAAFTQTQKMEAPPDDPTVNLFLKIYIPIGTGILLLIIGLIIFLVRRRKHH